jgi:hypothetical protein
MGGVAVDQPTTQTSQTSSLTSDINDTAQTVTQAVNTITNAVAVSDDEDLAREVEKQRRKEWRESMKQRKAEYDEQTAMQKQELGSNLMNAGLNREMQAYAFGQQKKKDKIGSARARAFTLGIARGMGYLPPGYSAQKQTAQVPQYPVRTVSEQPEVPGTTRPTEVPSAPTIPTEPQIVIDPITGKPSRAEQAFNRKMDPRSFYS